MQLKFLKPSDIAQLNNFSISIANILDEKQPTHHHIKGERERNETIVNYKSPLFFREKNNVNIFFKTTNKQIEKFKEKLSKIHGFHFKYNLEITDLQSGSGY